MVRNIHVCHDCQAAHSQKILQIWVILKYKGIEYESYTDGTFHPNYPALF